MAQTIDVDTARDEKWCTADHTEMQALDEEIQDAEDNDDRTRLKKAKYKQKYMLISARNAHVTGELKKAYANIIPTGDLRVFCIANRDYKRFRSPRQRKWADISLINATSVLDLRRFCRSIPAKAQFEAGLHFLEIQIPTLLHSIELWISTGPEADRATKPKDTAYESAFLKQIGALVGGTQETIEVQFTSAIGETAAQYNAWCRNYGTHTTAKRGLRRWNMEITALAACEIGPMWQELELEYRRLFEKLEININGEIWKLASSVPEVSNRSPPSRAFLGNVKLRQQRVRYLLDEDLAKFLRRLKCVLMPLPETLLIDLFFYRLSIYLSIIHYNITGDHASSYILAEMLDTYRRCAMQSGTGRLSRQKGMMHDRLKNENLFSNIQKRIVWDFHNLLKEIFDRVHDNICTVLEQLGSDIGLLEGMEKGESDRFPEFKKEVVAMLSRTNAQLASVQRDISATRARFEGCA
ncbi:hypothetical protein GP486_005548 [Trichoglossum hirsutum]|uniref:DUF7605 domain-containing protein n=1 Tax=Trichoglossum hirsutum TaxID=265104 RepID=A0A9P8RMF6_9PEZI|nr:hypothetical protein GP486_005548 [Trichoglossum hirsutum]